MRIIFDPCGVLLVCVTWILLFVSNLTVVKYFIYAWFSDTYSSDKFLRLQDAGIFILVTYTFSLLLVFTSHVKAMTTDPGIIEEDVKVPPQLEAQARTCKICDNRWKPVRAHHCKLCKRCIFRMDHHCIWINNCVGMLNQKYFMLFLLYVALHAIFTLLLLGSGATLYFQQSITERDMDYMALGSGIFSSAIAVFFVFFCSDFLFEQLESIKTNTTLVETYQRVQGAEKTFAENMEEVFGHDRWRWFWPISPRIVPDYAEEVTPTAEDDDGSMGFSECGIAGDETEGMLESKLGDEKKSIKTTSSQPDAPTTKISTATGDDIEGMLESKLSDGNKSTKKAASDPDAPTVRKRRD